MKTQCAEKERRDGEEAWIDRAGCPLSTRVGDENVWIDSRSALLCPILRVRTVLKVKLR